MVLDTPVQYPARAACSKVAPPVAAHARTCTHTGPQPPPVTPARKEHRASIEITCICTKPGGRANAEERIWTHTRVQFHKVVRPGQALTKVVEKRNIEDSKGVIGKTHLAGWRGRCRKEITNNAV